MIYKFGKNQLRVYYEKIVEFLEKSLSQWHLLVQSQQWKHRTMSKISSNLKIKAPEWLIHCSGVFIISFKQVNASWDTKTAPKIFIFYNVIMQSYYNVSYNRAEKIRHTVVSCTYRVPEVVLRRMKYRVPKIFMSSL